MFTQIINCPRIYNIPALNFVIIGILGTFLLKLTTKYTGLYMKNSLITIIVTNLVLYGISETLAQSLLSYNPTEPRLSFKFNRTTGGYGRLRLIPTTMGIGIELGILVMNKFLWRVMMRI